MQRSFIQTKVHEKLFHCLKRTNSQTLKSSSCKKHFLQCVCYRHNLLLLMFLILFGNWKSLYFVKVCNYFEIISAAILWLSLKRVFWKKSVFYSQCYLHNITWVLIPKFPNKAIAYFAWQTFVTCLLLLTLFCDCFTFFINEFSLKNSNSCGSMFFTLVSFYKENKIREHPFR